MLYQNAHKSKLIEISLKRNESRLGPNGELVILTGTHTGRSANDKYVVLEENTKDKIWWENNINKMDEETFSRLLSDVQIYLENQPNQFFSEHSIGNATEFALNIECLTTEASASLFAQYMFKEKVEKPNAVFSIYHAPFFKLDPNIYKTKSDTVIVTCFKTKATIIVGTNYAGEIKKSMFSIMNFLLPDHGILPMHSGANQNANGESFVFFGLSGTGKTTLATDVGLQLIGDDEHGLSKNGVFNFEGGCYAKTYKLAAETEPEIYQASTRFGSFLENVKLSDDHSNINFFDDSITENGRSSYPLGYVSNRVLSGKGKIPKHIFYLSADAFGVLPPVSKLTPEEAMDYFVLGYSAKLAGTEVGLKTPQATFSACFGAPFMLRRPEVYAQLLKDMIKTYDIKVWLINTGWYGGSYGEGKRFPLSVTRSIVRAIQNGKLDQASYAVDEFFNFHIPESVDGVDKNLLVPKLSWKNAEDYQKTAHTLANHFKMNLLKQKGEGLS